MNAFILILTFLFGYGIGLITFLWIQKRKIIGDNSLIKIQVDYTDALNKILSLQMAVDKLKQRNFVK